ncbi:MAG: hypothetical protein R3B95_19020 [Nitrospirales bacterium]|nr:hypothetical protein [Nitrospirales bacterium]
MAKESKTFQIGRNADNGRLTSVDKARQHPKTHVVERMPKPGFGDTDSGKKKEVSSWKAERKLSAFSF